MTNFKRKLLSVGTAVTMAAPIATVVACGSDSAASWKQYDSNVLRTVVELDGGNAPNDFLYQSGISYGGGVAGEASAYVNSYEGKLIRWEGTNERVQGVSGSEFGDPTDKVFEQKLKLELAEALLVKDEKGNHTHAFFNDDEFDTLSKDAKYASLSHHKINDSDARALIDGVDDADSTIVGVNEAAEFVIREGLKWTDSNGNATKYDIVAEDFYYSMYHTGLNNNNWRNSPFDAAKNPFGGHGALGGEADDRDTEGANVNAWALADALDKEFIGTTHGNVGGGFPNTYLYTMFGLKTPAELVQGTAGSGAPADPAILGTFDGKSTVSFQSAGQPNAQLFNGVVKFWADGRTIAPVPSQKIDEAASNGDYDTANGVTIPDGIAKDLGYYSYGEKHSDVLYASPYYVAQSDTTRVKLVQNPNYWDKQWVADPKSVKEYIIDYVSPGGNFYQTQFSEYKNGRQYKVAYSQLDDGAKADIGDNGDVAGLRYAAPFNNGSFSNDMLNFMAPEAGLGATYEAGEGYLLNEHGAQLWFGSDLTTLDAGGHTISDYLNQDSQDFRSQLTAAINWYGFARILHPGGESEDWLGYMPAEIPLATKDSSDKTPYDFKEDLTTANYTIGGVAHAVTSKENQDHYIANVASNSESLKSADFEAISAAMTDLLTAQGVPSGEKVVIPVKERSGSNKETFEPLYVAYEETLEALDPRIDVQFFDYSQEWPGDLITQNGTERFGGWGSDYDGVGSMFTGLSSYGSSIQAMGMIINEGNVTGATSQEFPQLDAYGAEFESFVDNLITDFNTANPSAAGLVDAAAALKALGNDVTGVLSGNHGIVTALLPEATDLDADNTEQAKDDDGELVTDADGNPVYEDALGNDGNKYDKDNAINTLLSGFYNVLDASVATFDLQYFSNSVGDQEAIDLLTEVRQIMGVSFGVNRTISNRSVPAPVVYRNDLIIPIYTNGQSSILDWTVGGERAYEFA